MLLQKCRRYPLAAESPCKSAGGLRSQRIVPAEVREVSAISGCCRKSAGRFRYQRKSPAEVREVSAVSGLLLQNCRTFPLSADAVAKVQGVSAGSGLLLQKCRRFLSLRKCSCTFVGRFLHCFLGKIIPFEQEI